MAHAARSLTRDEPRGPFAAELLAALDESLGARFTVWTSRNGWERLDGREGGAPDLSPLACGPDAADYLARCAAGHDEPAVFAGSGHQLLLMPVPCQDANPLVAAARFPFSWPAEMLLRAARLFVSDFCQRQHHMRVQHELDVYAGQVTDDLEELTFLRTLAECLDVSDATQGRWQMAQSVLPFLRHTLRAETLALLAPQVSEPGDANLAPAPIHTVAWSGTAAVDEKTCRRLVEHYRDDVDRQPIVKNRMVSDGTAGSPHGLHDLIVVAIAREGRTFGWLVAMNRQRSRCSLQLDGDGSTALSPPPWGLSDLEFGTSEVSLLQSAALVFAASAHNVELLHERDNLLVGVVRALVNAIDARDPYTSGHSERVALIARRIGEELNLERQHCKRLYLTGLLHDVGKIGISDSVLRKTGKLTPEEFDEVKRHPALGCAILQDLRQLDFVLPGVRHHHENVDGKGYPDGLASDDIPLDARIIAVADAYDAMVNDRPYRVAMPHERVEGILREGAGRQWDARVLEVFFQSLDEIRTLVELYQLHAAGPRSGLSSADASRGGTRAYVRDAVDASFAVVRPPVD